MARSVLQWIAFFVLLLSVEEIAVAHEGHGGEGGEGGSGCSSIGDARVVAEFRPGIVTIDGRGDEWADADAFEFSLRPALDFDLDKEFSGGKMAVKALHDGNNVYFLLQVEGDFAYSKSDDYKCPSVALMFQIGENATYHNMGGCKKFGADCNSISCEGHEVDIMHFSIGNAIPGRLYGSNPIDNLGATGDDRFGHLIDVYAWNPHCLFPDGKGPSGNDSSARNDWQGAWWHSSLAPRSAFIEKDSPYSPNGQKGTYYFEFSRPIRTSDRVQQDVQFTIGQSSKVAVAFWYPSDGKPWKKSDHYSVSCDWIPLEFISASSTLAISRGSWDASSAFTIILSIVALITSFFVVFWASKAKSLPFTPIDRL
ncbi:heme binding protein [Wolffia australiana]